MKQTIHDILKFFREEADSNRDLGDKFERLIAAYLTQDPYYAGLFGNKVWLWQEWPGRGNKPDTGIDIVTEEVATGDVWAVQCKFLAPDHYLQKEDFDSFFTASGKEPFKHRLMFPRRTNGANTPKTRWRISKSPFRVCACKTSTKARWIGRTSN